MNDIKTKKQTGFTLIEVLVALAIISLITVVSIPNIRRYSQTQEIHDARAGLQSFLSSAQSNAISSIQCSDGTYAINRRVELRQTGYDLVTSCWTSTTNPTPKNDPETAPSVVYPTAIQMSTTSCGSSTADIVFESTRVHFYCDVAGVMTDQTSTLPSPFQITFHDTRGGSDLLLTIDKGGSISLP